MAEKSVENHRSRQKPAMVPRHAADHQHRMLRMAARLPRLFALDTGGPAGQLSAERHRCYLGYPPAGRFQLAVGQKH